MPFNTSLNTERQASRKSFFRPQVVVGTSVAHFLPIFFEAHYPLQSFFSAFTLPQPSVFTEGAHRYFSSSHLSTELPVHVVSCPLGTGCLRHTLASDCTWQKSQLKPAYLARGFLSHERLVSRGGALVFRLCFPCSPWNCTFRLVARWLQHSKHTQDLTKLKVSLSSSGPF